MPAAFSVRIWVTHEGCHRTGACNCHRTAEPRTNPTLNGGDTSRCVSSDSLFEHRKTTLPRLFQATEGIRRLRRRHDLQTHSEDAELWIVAPIQGGRQEYTSNKASSESLKMETEETRGRSLPTIPCSSGQGRPSRCPFRVLVRPFIPYDLTEEWPILYANQRLIARTYDQVAMH